MCILEEINVIVCVPIKKIIFRLNNYSDIKIIIYKVKIFLFSFSKKIFFYVIFEYNRFV